MVAKLIIGLTGGIGSGKSTVADIFASLGVDIIDTDIIAREIVAPQSATLTEIIKHFGTHILTSEKNLDRKKLRAIVFADPSEKIWLEKLLHPLINQQIIARIQNASSTYCIVVIPLLFETGDYEYLDRVLVIDTSEELQIQRTQQRDGCDKRQIQAIMAAQANRQHRINKADDVIVNDNNLTALHEEVTKLHNFYLSLVTNDSNSC